MTHTEQERAEFEAWARDRYPSINLTREGDGYRMSLAKDYWSLWQTACLSKFGTNSNAEYAIAVRKLECRILELEHLLTSRHPTAVPHLTLPIEIGKKYLRRDGKQVITQESHSPWKEEGCVCAIVCCDNQTWANVSAATGRYSPGSCHEDDIVADCIAVAPQPLEGDSGNDALQIHMTSADKYHLENRREKIAALAAATDMACNPSAQHELGTKAEIVDLPEPAGRTTSCDGEFYWDNHLASQESRFGAKLYTEQQVRALLAAQLDDINVADMVQAVDIAKDAQ